MNLIIFSNLFVKAVDDFMSIFPGWRILNKHLVYILDNYVELLARDGRVVILLRTIYIPFFLTLVDTFVVNFFTSRLRILYLPNLPQVFVIGHSVCVSDSVCRG